jgi:hypothetical protein
MVSLAERRRGAKHLEHTFVVSERRACQVAGIARSSKRRPSGRFEEPKLVTRISRLWNFVAVQSSVTSLFSVEATCTIIRSRETCGLAIAYRMSDFP